MASLNGSAAQAHPFRARPRTVRSKLRIGVFADSPTQPRWIADALARIAASDFAEIVVLALGGHAPAGSPLWQAYAHVDHWLFGSGDDPVRRVDIASLVRPQLRIALAPAERAWRARIADLRLDVAFAIGEVDDASLEGLARHGTWRHAFGEGQGVHPDLAAMPEILDESPVVASGIRIARPCGERLGCRSWSRTVPFSLARSRQRLFGKAGDHLALSLRRLYEDGEGWIDREAVPAPPRAAERMPNVAESVRGIGRLGARIAKRTLETCFTVGQWSLAFRFTPHEPWDGSLEGFHRLVPPPDRFWADPFPLSRNGRHYIFFEELPFDSGKGHISVVEVDREGNCGTPVRVLERDYHLSYPLLVEDDGALYMIPETANNRTIEIYRCEAFPDRWRREKVFVEGCFAADATVHRDRETGRWWMFANIGSDIAGGVDDELHLFHSPALLAEWTPHARNPVKSDVRSSRPAGYLFERDGALWRPGQICAPIYGSGIVLHRVTRLDTDEYAEEEERRIVPRTVLGMHTINRCGDLSVTDAFERRRRF